MAREDSRFRKFRRRLDRLDPRGGLGPEADYDLTELSDEDLERLDVLVRRIPEGCSYRRWAWEIENLLASCYTGPPLAEGRVIWSGRRSHERRDRSYGGAPDARS